MGGWEVRLLVPIIGGRPPGTSLSPSRKGMSTWTPPAIAATGRQLEGDTGGMGCQGWYLHVCVSTSAAAHGAR